MSNGKNQLQTIHALFSLLLSIPLIWPGLPIWLYQIFISSNTCTFSLCPQKNSKSFLQQKEIARLRGHLGQSKRHNTTTFKTQYVSFME
jgi:hypothetical protein